jgi:hypothetical protein
MSVGRPGLSYVPCRPCLSISSTVSIHAPAAVASEFPLRTTSAVPPRIAIAVVLPLVLQVRQRLAARIIPQVHFRLSRQDTSLLTSKIDPQFAAGKTSEVTHRTTPGTVPGAVPKATCRVSLSASHR